MVSQVFIDRTHNLTDFVPKFSTFYIIPSTLAYSETITAEHRFLISGFSGFGNFEFSQQLKLDSFLCYNA